MKKLQCVIHAPSNNTLLIKQKVTGALIEKTSNLDISIASPFETNAKDILEADGLLIGTTENLASMACATKDFFDRTYCDLLGKKEEKLQEKQENLGELNSTFFGYFK